MEAEPKPRHNPNNSGFRSFHDVFEQISREEDTELDRLENLERMMQEAEPTDLLDGSQD